MLTGQIRAVFCAITIAALLPLAGSARANRYLSIENNSSHCRFCRRWRQRPDRRILADKLQASLGQTVVVENKVGAGGRIAAGNIADEPAGGWAHPVAWCFRGDGHLACGHGKNSLMSQRAIFVPVSQVAAFPLVMVTGIDHPAKTVKEFVEWAKANPRQVQNCGTTSPAFTLAVELFEAEIRRADHGHSHKSGNEMVVSVMSATVDHDRRSTACRSARCGRQTARACRNSYGTVGRHA